MALLTAEEKAKLAEEGIGYGVKEKCDCCHRPILSPLSFIKKKQTLCASCAKGKDLVLQNTKEENEMAIKKAEKKAEAKAAPKKETTKIAGTLVEGTAIADLYLFLEDEKVHKLGDAKKVLSKHKADPMGRIYQLGRYGKKLGTWAVIIDEDTIQLKKGKAAAAAAEKKPAKKEEKPVAKKKASEPEEKAPVTSKAAKAVQLLVRRTLKTGKDWTKNKLIEHLEDQDPKRVEAALKEEIKAGGILLEDGVLTLA